MDIPWDIETMLDPDAPLDQAQAIQEIHKEKRHRGEQVRAALFTYRVCYVTKTVGTGLGQMSYQDYGAKLGYQKSYVTNLRRLGRALVVHRVPWDSPLFSKLRNASVYRDVAELLDRDEPVPHDVLERAVAAKARYPRRQPPPPTEDAPQVVIQRAIGTLQQVARDADEQLLAELEESIGDLFFHLREALRARQSGAHGDAQGAQDAD